MNSLDLDITMYDIQTLLAMRDRWSSNNSVKPHFTYGEICKEIERRTKNN